MAVRSPLGLSPESVKQIERTFRAWPLSGDARVREKSTEDLIRSMAWHDPRTREHPGMAEYYSIVETIGDVLELLNQSEAIREETRRLVLRLRTRLALKQFQARNLSKCVMAKDVLPVFELAQRARPFVAEQDRTEWLDSLERLRRAVERWDSSQKEK